MTESKMVTKTQLLKTVLLCLIIYFALIFRLNLVQAESETRVASGWLGIEDILFTVMCSFPSGDANEWKVGENTIVNFTFKSYVRFPTDWEIYWEYPLKIRSLEIEIHGAGIDYKEEIVTNKVLNYQDEVTKIVAVQPEYEAKVISAIDISFDAFDLAHKNEMTEHLERITFDIATVRPILYDDLVQYYGNSQRAMRNLENRINIITILMYGFLATTVVFTLTTYFVLKKKKE